MSAVWPYLAAIVPTILVAILFYFLIRSMLEGDRRERLAQSQYEAAQALRHTAPDDSVPPGRGDEPSPREPRDSAGQG